jgi:hypothetical protein
MSGQPRSVAPADPRRPFARASVGGRAWSALGRVWRRFLALSRLRLGAVCGESADLGPHDYHNYRDDAGGAGWFTEGGARCRRCGKWFRL